MLLTLLEETATELSASNIFTTATEVMTGFVTLSVNFVSSIWNANAIGKIIIVLPFVAGAVALGYRIFMRRKHV